MRSIVFMGVAGCGKSTLATAVASSLDCLMIEGDDFHPKSNIEKMHNGIPLTDEDRASWLDALGQELAKHPDGVCMTCSALKRAYREKLRAYSPNLAFVYLEISREDALERVAAREQHHIFPASLVDSQFATLEPPTRELAVITVQAVEPLPDLVKQVIGQLHNL